MGKTFVGSKTGVSVSMSGLAKITRAPTQCQLPHLPLSTKPDWWPFNNLMGTTAKSCTVFQPFRALGASHQGQCLSLPSLECWFATQGRCPYPHLCRGTAQNLPGLS